MNLKTQSIELIQLERNIAQGSVKTIIRKSYIKEKETQSMDKNIQKRGRNSNQSELLKYGKARSIDKKLKMDRRNLGKKVVFGVVEVMNLMRIEKKHI